MRVRWWTGLVRVLAPAGAFAVEGWPALIAAILVQEGGLWLTGRLTGRCQTTAVQRLFLLAYGARMAVALPTHYVAKFGNGNGALFRDDYTNDLVGEWLGRIARGDGIAIFAGHQYLLSTIYTYLLMGLYALFGYHPLLPKLLNIGLAGLCAVLVFEITDRAFDRRAAILAGLGAALLPSLIVWSAATIKETPVLFAGLVALWLVQFLSAAPRLHPRVGDALVTLAALLLLLLDLRSPMTVILVGLLAVIAIARSRARLRGWQFTLASAAVIGLIVGSLVAVRLRTSDRPLLATFDDVAVQIRHRRAQEAAGANSQVRPELEVISDSGTELPDAEFASDRAPFSLTADVIDPLGYALLAPAPWQASSLLEVAASAEMPVWYVLLIASFFAWRAVAARQRLFVLVLAMYGVANWLILAAVEGNLGNLLRHRLMLDPALLILGAAGLCWWWTRLRTPSLSPVSAVEKAQLPDHQGSNADHEHAPHHDRERARPGNAAESAVGAAHRYDAEPAVGGREQRQGQHEANRQ